jgi:hypothetical protein
MSSDKAMEVAKEIYRCCTAKDDFDFKVGKCSSIIEAQLAQARLEGAEAMQEAAEKATGSIDVGAGEVPSGNTYGAARRDELGDIEKPRRVP